MVNPKSRMCVTCTRYPVSYGSIFGPPSLRVFKPPSLRVPCYRYNNQTIIPVPSHYGYVIVSIAVRVKTGASPQYRSLLWPRFEMRHTLFMLYNLHFVAGDAAHLPRGCKCRRDHELPNSRRKDWRSGGDGCPGRVLCVQHIGVVAWGNRRIRYFDQVGIQALGAFGERKRIADYVQSSRALRQFMCQIAVL